MEELIWKYLDGECTQDELDKIKQLKEKHTDFKALFERSQHLHHKLATNNPIPMETAFKHKLCAQLENRAKSLVIVQRPILSVWWIISLTLLAISSVTIALLFPGDTRIFSNWHLPFSQQTMQYGILVMSGFLTLTLADYLINKPTMQRKPIYTLM